MDKLTEHYDHSFLRGRGVLPGAPKPTDTNTVAETCGAMIDQVNQRLQLLMFMVEGNVQAETEILGIARMMREHWKEHRQ